MIPVLIFPLVVALIVGLFFVFRADDNVEPKDPDATDNGTIVDPEDIQHTTGNPVIEFDEGNEAYLDESIVSYLERMDQGVPSIDENGNYYLYEDGDVVYDYSGEKKLEAVLDNVILLINHFVKENYSMEALQQRVPPIPLVAVIRAMPRQHSMQYGQKPTMSSQSPTSLYLTANLTVTEKSP